MIDGAGGRASKYGRSLTGWWWLLPVRGCVDVEARQGGWRDATLVKKQRDAAMQTSRALVARGDAGAGAARSA